MITDREPGGGVALSQYRKSDELRSLASLPHAPDLQARSRAFDAALKSGEPRLVQAAGDDLLDLLARTYGVPRPELKVLGTRPRKSWEGGGFSELFGDYDFEAARIRLWMRTAVLGKVTSYRGALNTLLHEFCHHLDVKKLDLTDTPHTRGFYGRVDDLYHLALATPPEKRKPLVWIRMGRGWRVDWRKLRASG